MAEATPYHPRDRLPGAPLPSLPHLDAFSRLPAFGLKLARARALAREVPRELAGAADGWAAHFRAQGVGAADIGVRAQYIGGDRLASARRRCLA